MPLITAVRLSKTYRAGDVDVPAVREVSCAIEKGSFVAFVDRAALDTTVQLGGNLDGDADRFLLGEQPAAPEGQPCAVEDG